MNKVHAPHATLTLADALAAADRGGRDAPHLLTRSKPANHTISARPCCNRSGIWRYLGYVRPGFWIDSCKAHTQEVYLARPAQPYIVLGDNSLHMLPVRGLPQS